MRISPAVLGSGADLETSPTQFKPWETKLELKSGDGPLSFDLPVP